MKTNLTIRKTAICPAGNKVKSLIESGQHSFQSTIGTEKLTGKFPVYIDEIYKPNMYGFVESIENISENDFLDLLEENYIIKINSIEGNIFHATFETMSEAAAAISGNTDIEAQIEVIAKEQIAQGIQSAEDWEIRKKLFKDNQVDPYLVLRTVKKYRKHKREALHPSCFYVDPFLKKKRRAKEEGRISEGLRTAASCHAVICEGEKSVGKDVYVNTIAFLKNMPKYLVTFNRQMSPSAVYGDKSTDNSASEYLASAEAQEAFEAEQKIKEVDDAIKAVKEVAMAKIGEEEFRQEYARFVDEQILNGNVEALLQADTGKESVLEMMILKNPAYSKALKDLRTKKSTLERRVIDLKQAIALAQSVNVVMDPSELVAWLEDGGVMAFDELNMAEANLLQSFANPLLDGTGFLPIPGKGKIAINPDCVLFATQNPDYQGVEAQNEATMSRFGCLYFPQPESVLAQITTATTAAVTNDGYEMLLDKKYFEQTDAFYKHCRKAIASDTITNAALNIRGMVRALTEVAESHGFTSLKKQLEVQVINTCPFDEREPLRVLLNQIVTL